MKGAEKNECWKRNRRLAKIARRFWLSHHRGVCGFSPSPHTHTHTAPPHHKKEKWVGNAVTTTTINARRKRRRRRRRRPQKRAHPNQISTQSSKVMPTALYDIWYGKIPVSLVVGIKLSYDHSPTQAFQVQTSLYPKGWLHEGTNAAYGPCANTHLRIYVPLWYIEVDVTLVGVYGDFIVNWVFDYLEIINTWTDR